MTEAMRMEVMRSMIQGEIHRARITDADLHYVGSTAVDEDPLNAAGIVGGQCVDIADIDSGKRLSIYAIARPRDSDVVQLSGTAAHLVSIDDLVIIMTCCQVFGSQARGRRPAIAFVGEHNRIIETGDPVGRMPEGSERVQEFGLKSTGKS